jgi:hypothetical protein
MTKQDRAKMEARLDRALPLWSSGVSSRRNLARFVALEVTRAVSAERKDQQELRSVCHDCKVVLVSEGPVLCQDCLETRMTEGMDHDDKRTIHTWRRT